MRSHHRLCKPIICNPSLWLSDSILDVAYSKFQSRLAPALKWCPQERRQQHQEQRRHVQHQHPRRHLHHHTRYPSSTPSRCRQPQIHLHHSSHHTTRQSDYYHTFHTTGQCTISTSASSSTKGNNFLVPQHRLTFKNRRNYSQLNPAGNPPNHKTITGDEREIWKPPNSEEPLPPSQTSPTTLPDYSALPTAKQLRAYERYARISEEKRRQAPVPTPAPPKHCKVCGMLFWTAEDSAKRAHEAGKCHWKSQALQYHEVKDRKVPEPTRGHLRRIVRAGCPKELTLALERLYQEVDVVDTETSKMVLRFVLERRWIDQAVDLLFDTRLGLSNVNGLKQIYDYLIRRGPMQHMYPAVVQRALSESYIFTNDDEIALRALIEDSKAPMTSTELSEFWEKVQTRIPSPDWKTRSLWIRHARQLLKRVDWPKSGVGRSEHERLLRTALEVMQDIPLDDYKHLVYPIGSFIGHWMKSWQKGMSKTYVEDYNSLHDHIPYLDDFLAGLEPILLRMALPYALDYYGTPAQDEVQVVEGPKVLWAVVCTISRTPCWRGRNPVTAKLERIISRYKKLEYYLTHRNEMELATNLASLFIAGGLKEKRLGKRKPKYKRYELSVIETLEDAAHGQADKFLMLFYLHFSGLPTTQNTLFIYIVRFCIQTKRYGLLERFLQRLPQPSASRHSRRIFSEQNLVWNGSTTESISSFSLSNGTTALTPASSFKHPAKVVEILIRHAIADDLRAGFHFFLLHPHPTSVARLVAKEISEKSNLENRNALFGLQILLHLRDSHLGRLKGLYDRGLYLYIATGLILSFLPPRSIIQMPWPIKTPPNPPLSTGRQHILAAFPPALRSPEQPSGSFSIPPIIHEQSITSTTYPPEPRLPPSEVKKYFFLIARMMRNRGLKLGPEMAILLRRLIDECEERDVYMEPYLLELCRLWSIGSDWNGSWEGKKMERSEFWRGF